jgi:serine/threonine protein phosphatase PrpC
MVRTAAAQLPEPPYGADRIIVTGNAVIVLDGASAFEPAGVPPGEYASSLGDSIAAALDKAPAAPLASVLAEAIAAAASALGLDDDDGCPSSTVVMARLAGGTLDLLALGDSYIFYGTGPATGMLTDGRLSGLHLPQQRQYRERLAAGGGYDDAHRELLRALQRGQRLRRNRPGGYWIAAADPAAAGHALALTLPATAETWAVLATDGVVNTARHLGLDDWPALARSGPAAVTRLLRHCQDWEQHADPDGQQLPRSKRHDDKAIAALTAGR